MRRSVIQGWLFSMLIALLQGKPSMAADCEQNAAQPRGATVVYDSSHTVLFKPQADGVLRALDAESNDELWALTPPTLDATHRSDGLLSDLRVLRFDADQDGSLDVARGDRVWLYFGLRRGGQEYYAYDVTERSSPRLLWQIGAAELPGLGETWPTPSIGRVRIAGATQNGEHFVLILGGGYDETLASGQRIFIVDAATGQLLWYAGGPGIGAPDFALAQMTQPIAARVAALDTDGDQFTDRLYAADLGGRVWRLDIWNGRDRSQLVTGGVLAALAGPLPEDMRRFFNAPDVALIQRRGAAAYYNLAIGSGDRAAPFDYQVHDRIYSLRDRSPFVKLSQADYDSLVPTTDIDPLDITDTLGAALVPASTAGWKLELRLNGGWSGEKVLAEALTVNGVVLVPTYKPISEVACAGENRVYALNVDHGNPAVDINDDKRIDSEDASTALAQSGIAGEVELSLPTAQSDADGGNTSPPGGESGSGITCKVGRESLRLCVSGKRSMRTFWQRRMAD